MSLNSLPNYDMRGLKEATGNQQQATSNTVDITLPGSPTEIGTRHPLSIVRNNIVSIFKRLGFAVAEGPEIEDDWHNFGAMNLPEDHPARDMQDTFYINQNPGMVASHTYQQCAGACNGNAKAAYPYYLPGPCVSE